jgi:protein PhnA
MIENLACRKCQSTNTYEDTNLWICADCGAEWSPETNASPEPIQIDDGIVRDAHGVALQDGDSVIVMKDLKIKGASKVLKGGTKVRKIRIKNAEDGHNLACQIDGIGDLMLKSEFVKKA